MRKHDELTTPESCLNRALDHEIVFVLLARDPAAPEAILRWADYRVRSGMNRKNDPQILEARECAKAMENQCIAIRRQLRSASND